MRWSPVVADDTLRYDVADLERVSRLLASQDGSGWLVRALSEGAGAHSFCCPQLVSRRTRLVIANVPNNPTGWLPSHDEWQR